MYSSECNSIDLSCFFFLNLRVHLLVSFIIHLILVFRSFPLFRVEFWSVQWTKFVFFSSSFQIQSSLFRIIFKMLDSFPFSALKTNIWKENVQQQNWTNKKKSQLSIELHFSYYLSILYLYLTLTFESRMLMSMYKITNWSSSKWSIKQRRKKKL